MMNEEILSLVADLAEELSPSKIQALAERLPEDTSPTMSNQVTELLGSQKSRNVLKRLITRCAKHEMTGEILAAMLLSASATRQRLELEQSIEVVWTGPTTSFVPTRRTEQVLLDLINQAQNEIFVVSFVAYDVSSIVDAMNMAISRGVTIRILLEASETHGGSLQVDPIATMKASVEAALLYTWIDKPVPFTDGRVHAKIAVADGSAAFLSSANLTGHALEKNIEAGVLIRGGNVPSDLNSHLHALIDTNVLKEV